MTYMEGPGPGRSLSEWQRDRTAPEPEPEPWPPCWEIAYHLVGGDWCANRANGRARCPKGHCMAAEAFDVLRAST